MQINLLLLRRQHAEIVAACNDLISLFSSPAREVSGRVAAARGKLGRLIAEHLKTENDELHVQLQNRGLTGAISSYAEIADRTRELRLTYSDHVHKWRSTTIELDWIGYTSAAYSLCNELKNLIGREERELFPAAQTLLITAH